VTPDDRTASAHFLLAKPRVCKRNGRYWVVAEFSHGWHEESWLSHETAMNCALAIAKGSRCHPKSSAWLGWSGKAL
jgi:hypothetical protein